MARLTYKPIFDNENFNKLKTQINLSDKWIGHLGDSPRDTAIKKAFVATEQNKGYRFNDTIYLAFSGDNKGNQVFPYSKVDQAIAAKCSFVTDKPAERRVTKNEEETIVVTKLRKAGYKETVFNLHSFWSPNIGLTRLY